MVEFTRIIGFQLFCRFLKSTTTKLNTYVQSVFDREKLKPPLESSILQAIFPSGLSYTHNHGFNTTRTYVSIMKTYSYPNIQCNFLGRIFYIYINGSYISMNIYTEMSTTKSFLLVNPRYSNRMSCEDSGCQPIFLQHNLTCRLVGMSSRRWHRSVMRKHCSAPIIMRW